MVKITKPTKPAGYELCCGGFHCDSISEIWHIKRGNARTTQQFSNFLHLEWMANSAALGRRSNWLEKRIDGFPSVN